RTVKSLVPLRTWIFLRVPRRRRLKMTSLGRKFSLKLVPPGSGGQGTTRVLEVRDGATFPILLDEPVVPSVVPRECGWRQALSAAASRRLMRCSRAAFSASPLADDEQQVSPVSFH